MDNSYTLKNKHIVITGASSGIGRSVAISGSKFGAKISLIGRSEITLKETLSLLEGNGHNIYVFDINNLDNIPVTIDLIVNKGGKIDGFVHSAGLELTRPLKMLGSVMLQNAFNTNVFSAFEFSKEISKNKNFNTGCSFVLISSIAAITGQAGKVGYSATKGALISGARSMAIELASKNIRVNCVSPALVETEMSANILQKLSEEDKEAILKAHPLGFGSPDDVANACIFLLSSMSKWVTGTNLIIDGGYSAV